MKALTYHGSKDVRVETVPDPVLQEDDDILLRVTATRICGSGLHIFRGKIPMMKTGDILGHEFMGFEKGLTFKGGQTHAQRFMPELLGHIADGKLSPDAIISHRMSLADAARGYEVFNEKQEDCRKVVLTPGP